MSFSDLAWASLLLLSIFRPLKIFGYFFVASSVFLIGF